MTGSLNILRTAVQIKGMHHLYEVQKNLTTLTEYGLGVISSTRRMPTRRAEILDGGSIYWVIKNKIQCRQAILGLDMIEESGERPFCQITLSPEIIRLHPRAKRAMQGWRYLESWDAPKDAGVFDPNSDEDSDNPIEQELKDLGIL